MNKEREGTQTLLNFTGERAKDGMINEGNNKSTKEFNRKIILRFNRTV